MSAVASTAAAVGSSMRIVALPLTRHVGGMKKPYASRDQWDTTTTTTTNDGDGDGDGDTPPPLLLTHYHFQITSRPLRREGGVVDTLVRKAGDMWAGFGKAPEGTWKVSTYLLKMVFFVW
jgi:hypothetical protein